jgi:hypothetical protein
MSKGINTAKLRKKELIELYLISNKTLKKNIAKEITHLNERFCLRRDIEKQLFCKYCLEDLNNAKIRFESITKNKKEIKIKKIICSNCKKEIKKQLN